MKINKFTFISFLQYPLCLSPLAILAVTIAFKKLEKGLTVNFLTGLEAMQLLSCLNLSHNKFGSFTALGPLRLLKSLKVLNISCNELGSHSIDTRRYLCSSPLAHSEVFAWDRFEILCGSYSATKFWEAFLIFESLNLTDLNIAGNAVADENFASFIVKVLPTLKLLNDEEL